MTKIGETTTGTPTKYDTISAAEDALRNAGFTRDAARALWVHPSFRDTAKVVRQDDKFIIQKS